MSQRICISAIPEKFGHSNADLAGGVPIGQLEALAGKATEELSTGGLTDRLRDLSARSYSDRSSMYRLHNWYGRVADWLAILAIADHRGVQVDEAAWETGRSCLETLLEERDWALQWRLCKRKRSDLATAEIGNRIALLVALAPTALQSLLPALRDKVAYCGLDAIRSEWLDPATRFHSHDGMGHNYWSVLVGSAGIMAAWLGLDRELNEAIEGLEQWCRYPGNTLSRKPANFSEKGDYREGFGYGQFALSNLLVLGQLQPELASPERFLSREQWEGTCEWLKRMFVPARDGLWPLRWGDAALDVDIRAFVWHRLAKIAADADLLELAHRVQPEPRGPDDLLCWQAAGSISPKGETAASPIDISSYPASGMLFMNGPEAQLATRAGEYWNHSHLDVGSFMWFQDQILWIDDSGMCSYDLPEYRSHFVTAAAHNVAYAPALTPSSKIGCEEGMPAAGQVVATASSSRLAMAVLDTNLLSSLALSRSLRWFFLLDGEALIVWDDLRAYRPERFESRLHTRYLLCDSSEGSALCNGDYRCPLAFGCDAECERTVELAWMGELHGGTDMLRGGGHTSLRFEDARFMEGRCIRWAALPTERIKFGLILGTGVRYPRWRMNDPAGGWSCSLETAQAKWEIWFNPLADGRTRGFSPVSRWGELETDGYALARRQGHEDTSLYAVQSSWVRDGATVRHHCLRQTLLELM